MTASIIAKRKVLFTYAMMLSIAASPKLVPNPVYEWFERGTK